MPNDIKILVVDDDPYLLDLLIETLQTIGYDSIAAGGAKEALELLQSTTVHLIITDIKMPGMSGIEFAQVVKKDYPDIPVIFITGVFNSSIVQMNDSAGFLAKPFRIGQLEELIHIAIRKSSDQDSSEDADTILVVDDDNSFRFMLMETLKLAGYSVVGAANGTEALTLLERGGIGTVITDMKMPEVDGISLVKLIKNNWPSIPVIFVTAYIHAEDALMESEVMTDGFLMKPFRMESITKILGELSKNKKQLPT
jgi:DNA-binding NtrC family response regulator